MIELDRACSNKLLASPPSLHHFDDEINLTLQRHTISAHALESGVIFDSNTGECDDIQARQILLYRHRVNRHLRRVKNPQLSRVGK
ncbi:hypothetical protein PROFUN_15524 [Planoprotostelium fungivorum]|uniref:Uncharacterized protein n=1 Tax=Planoprotostelium fungivorum TaxID=1890364 RepID=A0A2P6MVV7_9EUKA|nr:hypothetical protein PROFUN_15524 [Planoprotostelium fungivorum]